MIARLLESREPSIRWKARVHVLGEDPDSGSIHRLQEEIRRSGRTRVLLKERARPGPRKVPLGVYWKWTGIHWALAHLADLGYPAGDASLRPRIDRALNVWLGPNYFREYERRGPEAADGDFLGSAVPRGPVPALRLAARERPVVHLPGWASPPRRADGSPNG